MTLGDYLVCSEIEEEQEIELAFLSCYDFSKDFVCNVYSCGSVKFLQNTLLEDVFLFYDCSFVGVSPSDGSLRFIIKDC